MLKKIVSGGQTGVDRAGLDAAIECNFPHGGWCPKGRIAEDGVLEKKYNLQETKSKNYTIRTEQNVIDSDGTLIFVNKKIEGGTLNTANYCKKHLKPLEIVNIELQIDLERIKNWIINNEILILNIAGPRASKQPDIYLTTKKIIGNLILALKS